MQWVALLSVTLFVAACSIGADHATPSTGLTIVATSTVLGDVVGAVAGEDALVEILVPIGADPHDYQPSARQVASIDTADLVVVNGLGLEEGLVDVLQAARADGANILELAPLLDPIPLTPHTDQGQGTEEERADDPHVWMDPVRMADAARLIGNHLDAIDSTLDWSKRAETYADSMTEADLVIVGLLATVPEDRRKLVTSHDSFGYFATRYGFDVIGTVASGGSTLADPSSAQLADLVAVMRREGVDVIFTDMTRPAALAEAVAAELGESVEVVDLYSGSLGEPGSRADTLRGMLVENAGRISEALR